MDCLDLAGQRLMTKCLIGMSFLLLFLGWNSTVRADDFVGAPKRTPMRFTPKPDAQIPMNLNFRNEGGDSVELGKLFQQKPVILNLVYFNCPQMCTEVLNGLVAAMRKIPLQLGKDYNVITLSIDEREKPPVAKAKKALYVDRYHRQGTAAGWSFLTGQADSIQSLADAVGFHYHYYPDIDQFDHALGIVVLTPEGKVAQYFYGIRYDPKKLRSALIAASKQ
jgi:protein SCO1/2